MRDPSGHEIHYNPGEPPDYDDEPSDDADLRAEVDRLRATLGSALNYLDSRLYKEAARVIRAALAED